MKTVSILVLIAGFLAQQGNCCCGAFVGSKWLSQAFASLSAAGACDNDHEHHANHSSAPCEHESDHNDGHQHHLCFGAHVFATSPKTVGARDIVSAAIAPSMMFVAAAAIIQTPANYCILDSLAPVPTLPLRAALQVYRC